MLKKLLKQLNKIKSWRHKRAIDILLKESGIDVSPEDSVWGIISKTEEDIVLTQLYNNKLWVALMRKYAEGANKALIQDVKKQDWHEASRHNGQFFSYNNILIKAKRANDNQFKHDQNHSN